MKFHTKYNPPVSRPSPAGKVSRTHAEYLKETDINLILKRYNSGDTSAVRSAGVFADVSDLTDFAQCMELVRKSREDFEALPSDVRERFGNDPTALIKFLADRSNDEEAIRLGLRVRPVVEKTLAEQIVEGVTTAVEKSGKVTTSPAS